ncbi:hypothetical protein [Lentzea jiangxiensis]|uniref:DUF8175 domain-containing protein n=1 Tax=Lentzea jiangxiensis TaxID=641025 RepID=A0A1H0X4K7_9PSEU|nr:hypothetical protein [Lentzea jiangxiensis]SDP97842.1 hypothetical protein SAMN05421507_13420 [Lentzea jiangxiensis]
MSFTSPAAHTGPRSAARRPLLLVLAAAVLLIGGVVIGRYGVPATDEPTETGQVPRSSAPDSAGAREHGPSKIVKGVPSGFTRDREGAASAAVIAVQLPLNIARNYADLEVVKSTWLARDADAATRREYSERGSTTGDDLTIKMPADVTVKDFNGDNAVVEVWVSTTGVAPGFGGRGTTRSQSFSTVTVELVWEREDWKVVTFTTSDGPRPGTDTAAPAPTLKPFAFYGFFLTIE